MKKNANYTIDFETYSEADLKTVGLANYAEHESTELLCMSYGLSGKEPKLWLPGDPFPTVLTKHLAKRGSLFSAHNAGFERALWTQCAVSKYDFPSVPAARWHCTATQAAHANLPRALDKVGPALGVSEVKDKEGHRLMLKCCKPVRDKRNTDPETLEKVYEYCNQDVRAEINVEAAAPPLPHRETRLELITHRINQRGMPVDMPLAKGAATIVEIASHLACEELKALTWPLGSKELNPKEVVEKPTQTKRIVDFLETIGCRIPNLQAETVAELLTGDKVQGVARRILEIRRDTAGAAVKKYKAILAQASPDNRCRNAYRHYAAGTGRWGGAGVQFQNLKRAPKGFEFSEELRNDIVSANYDAIAKRGDPFTVLGDCLRSVVYPGPGRLFVESDLAGIENRMTHYLADDYETLEAFRNDADLYLDLAAEIYDVPRKSLNKESPERHIGKIAVLGLGFCLGPNGFRRHVKAFTGEDCTDEFASNVVSIYRNKFKPVTDLWREIGMGAVACVRTGRPVMGRYWKFAMQGDWLTMRLPSGRKLFYHKPELEAGQWGLEIVYESARGRRTLSTPILVENLVQATARDVIAENLTTCDEEFMYVIGTTHDSIYLEIDENDDETPQRLTEIMERVPSWLPDFPMATETIVTERMH